MLPSFYFYFYEIKKYFCVGHPNTPKKGTFLVNEKKQWRLYKKSLTKRLNWKEVCKRKNNSRQFVTLNSYT